MKRRQVPRRGSIGPILAFYGPPSGHLAHNVPPRESQVGNNSWQLRAPSASLSMPRVSVDDGPGPRASPGDRCNRSLRKPARAPTSDFVRPALQSGTLYSTVELYVAARRPSLCRGLARLTKGTRVPNKNIAARDHSWSI